MAMFSPRFDAALAFAARAHGAQLRKGTSVPYITHPYSVALYLAECGRSEDIVIAGLLHDVVEDTGTSIEEVRERFGDKVAELVAAVSERKRENGVERSWEDRKREAIDHLEHAGPEVVALKAADALHNVSTTAVALGLDGPSVWSRFKRGPTESLWYYGEIARLALEVLGDDRLAVELERAVKDLRRIAAAGPEWLPRGGDRR